jgi:hypothetical protein
MQWGRPRLPHVFRGRTRRGKECHRCYAIEMTRHEDTGVNGRAHLVNTKICVYNKNNPIPCLFTFNFY